MAGKTARALELLARVERRELDRERQDLAAVSGQLAAALDALARLDGRFGSELGLALAMPDGPRLAAAYAHGHRVRRAEGAAEVGRLGVEVGRLGEAVKARAVALRTLELAAERVEEREEAEVAARQQAQLDEVAVLRHAAAASGAG